MLPTSNSIDDDSGLKNVHKQIYGYKASSYLITSNQNSYPSSIGSSSIITCPY